ncbi:hypothetical protein evm_014748 [Chilo suppressalis]|nr:hypothetical protein evm_014748 [Chilo suppressalis]
MVPTTCLDNVSNISPPPLPPRAANPRPFPMHRSLPPTRDNPPELRGTPPELGYDPAALRRSSHSLDGELDAPGPQPNSIAMQMNYPLVNAPPPPIQTDNRSSLPVLHMRSRSSPEQLETDTQRRCDSQEACVVAALPPTPAPAPAPSAPPGPAAGPVPRPGSGSSVSLEAGWWRGTPPPGTPPPPYAHNTQPCADPQRAIISMEEDDSPASDNSGLFSNLRSVRESRARTAVLLNWLLGERR